MFFDLYGPREGKKECVYVIVDVIIDWQLV